MALLGHFGFSWIGAAFLLGLFVPNLIWASAARPAGYDPSGESPVLQWFERIGQALTVAAALLLADTNPGPWSPWSWWLVAAVVCMALYEAAWIRYFASARTMATFYRPFLGVPVPLATLPVAAFLLLAAYGRLLTLALAVVVLGIGHIGIHMRHARESTAAARG
ncbi:MAG: hypothetical protein J7480_08135 [Microbacteriaceae bacterium]|nr:hypothetical protein [Microbacteriaceae bacterium]